MNILEQLDHNIDVLTERLKYLSETSKGTYNDAKLWVRVFLIRKKQYEYKKQIEEEIENGNKRYTKTIYRT